MGSCLITVGRVLRAGRISSGMSQRDFAEYLHQKFGNIEINFLKISAIENERVDIRDRQYDFVVSAICDRFGLDPEWLEVIREQSEVKERDLGNGIFHVYMKELVQFK